MVASGGPAPDPAPAVARLTLPGLAYGDTEILGPIDLSVRAGETLAITGPSGIGKTTLLRLLAGLERRPGIAVTAPRATAMVFQEPTLLPWRTALQNVTLVARVTEVTARAALQEVGLGGLGHRHPNALSLGQQRRLSLARAFASAPDLLLMDEPFVSLDAATAEEMMRLFARLRAGRRVATLLVTHVPREAEVLATRIVTLAGRPATVASDRRNRKAHLAVAT